MANELIDPIGRLSQLGDIAAPYENVRPAPRPMTGNFFEDVLGKAMESLEGVSAAEMKSNALIHGYLDGKADLVDVMTAVSETSFLVQLAATVSQSAVQSFKELTSMQI